MNTTTIVVATAALVVAGRWADDKKIDVSIAVGAGALAVSLSLIAAADARLAQQFALLVLMLAAFRYVPPIARAINQAGD